MSEWVNNIKDTKLLFYDDHNETGGLIINGGLMLKPTNALIIDKMFGYGIHYILKARKPLGYTSLFGSIHYLLNLKIKSEKVLTMPAKHVIIVICKSKKKKTNDCK